MESGKKPGFLNDSGLNVPENPPYFMRTSDSLKKACSSQELLHGGSAQIITELSFMPETLCLTEGFLTEKTQPCPAFLTGCK